MDNRRQLMREALSGAAPAVPPVCLRLDLWYRDAAARGSLPEVFAGFTVAGIEDALGFCRSARWRAAPEIVFPAGRVERAENGAERRTVFHFPGARLERVERLEPGAASAGMRPATVAWPARDEPGCRALLAALEEAAIRSSIDGFEAFDRETGPAGLPVLVLGSCPAHALMLDWFGYENFFYALADYPALVAELVSRLEALYRRDLWGQVMAGGAEIILHGNHFSDAATPPPVFRRFFLPYFRDFNGRARAAGKKVLWHADAAMGSLLGLVLEAGFAGADCLATAPLARETLADYERAWQGRIACWGGLPGVIFNPEFPEARFREHLAGVARFTAGRAGFIIGISDNLVPGALFGRVEAVSRAFRRAPAA